MEDEHEAEQEEEEEVEEVDESYLDSILRSIGIGE